MKTVDRALQGSGFKVVPSACYEAAQQLKTCHPEVESGPWHDLNCEHSLAFKIAFISVCHQINWDYLQSKLATLLLDDPISIVSTLLSITAKDISELLGDYPKPERIRARERAAYLRDVGKVISREWNDSAANMLTSTQNRCGGPDGFIQKLDAFIAFRSDPLRKKSHVLIHDLVREKIVEFDDPENIEPAIDYHLIRIYLRTGRVIPLERAIVPFLGKQPNPRDRLVKLLREAVSEAATLTAFYAGHSVADLNYIEWQLGRNICDGAEPRCDQSSAQLLPGDLSALHSDYCPYRDFCESYNHDEYGFLSEPLFYKNYY